MLNWTPSSEPSSDIAPRPKTRHWAEDWGFTVSAAATPEPPAASSAREFALAAAPLPPAADRAAFAREVHYNRLKPFRWAWVLLLTAPVSAAHIVLGKFLGLLSLLVFILAGCAAMLATLLLGTHADIGLMLSNLLGVLLLAASYAALGVYFSALNRQPIIAAISSLGLSFGLWLLEMSASDSRSFLRAISPNAHFQNINMGLVNSADLIYFALLIAYSRIMVTRGRF